MMLTKPAMAGLNVVLKSAPELTHPTPLNDWLPECNPAPVWVSLKRDRGVTKAMPILAQPDCYPALLQTICQQMTISSSVEWQGKTYIVSGIEVEPDDLFVLQLTLAPSKPLPPTLGRAVHALFFQWIARADEAIANSLHEMKGQLPMILSIQRSPSKTIQLNITLLNNRLLSPLLWGLSQDLGTDISITHIPCHLSQHIQIIAAHSFEKLMQIPAQQRLELEFRSPTSFKQHKKDIQPFPLPDLVFNSLRQRWNAFAPEHLQLPELDWHGLVSAFDLKTHALRMEGGPEIGCQGWVTYRFPDPEQAKFATTLAHFAFFAGVGRKTTMGMGQTRLLARSPIDRKPH